MARLKSLKLQLTFKESYKNNPIVVRYKGQQVDKLDLVLDKIGQTETITFEGFTHHGQQQVCCLLKYEGREVDLQSCSIFQMHANLYIENTEIPNYKDICYNGTLKLTFSKDWLRSNILSGANLDVDYVNWHDTTFTAEEIFCVGDSFTHGDDVARDETWPSMLDGKVCNFGSSGLSQDGCVKNVEHILQNSKHVKQIICLLPSATRKLLEFHFLNSKGSIPISLLALDRYQLPPEFENTITDTKDFILDTEMITKDWIMSCHNIIELCNNKNVECWISTWCEDMYRHIPNKHRLPIFPKMDTFNERASDNQHPHKKHYELFVKNIKPYIDKTRR